MLFFYAPAVLAAKLLGALQKSSIHQEFYHLHLVAVCAVLETERLRNAAHLGKAELPVQIPGAVIVGKHPQLHLRKAVFLRLLQRLFHQKLAEPQPPRFFS